MPRTNEPKRVTLRDARITNRNFSGRKTDYNEEGKRNFCVILTPDEAAFLKNEGWNVKNWPAVEPELEGGDVKDPFLPCHLGYTIRPPRVVMIPPNGNKLSLGESDLDILDWADILKVNLVANGVYWEKAGRDGIKAWIKTLAVWIDEDEIEAELGLNETLGFRGDAGEEVDDA